MSPYNFSAASAISGFEFHSRKVENARQYYWTKNSVKTIWTHSWGPRISWTRLMSKRPIGDSVRDPSHQPSAWLAAFRERQKQQQALRYYIPTSAPHMKRTLQKYWRALESVGKIFVSKSSIGLTLETSEGPCLMIWVWDPKFLSRSYEFARVEVICISFIRAEEPFCPLLIADASGWMPAV